MENVFKNGHVSSFLISRLSHLNYSEQLKHAGVSFRPLENIIPLFHKLGLSQ